MIIGKVTEMAPMPAPIPIAIVKNIIGEATKPFIMLLAIVAHLGYGGAFGGALALLIDPVTVKKAVGLSLALWIIMQIIVLPFIGWGVFGSAITPKIAVATLILHLVYGFVFGIFMDRKNIVKD